ncbi:O-antigen ligase family protein [Cohnella massiliensis]|uniref:O-antigen ligase family protein n=1 Tax=Cohnella massiliensis TaxID=1816691 RepID=UPI0009BA35D1|nr:O-antigen ligase family protein [Cohnella massiliensis]
MSRLGAWTARTAGGLALGAALGWSARRSGMFFDSDFYFLEIALIAAAAAVVLAGFVWPRHVRTPLWAFAPLGLALAFALLLASGPESAKGTADVFIRWTAYASWLVMLASFLLPYENRKTGWRAWHAVGLFVIGGSWAGWFGWIDKPGAVFRSGDAELASTGARLAGFLEYPNAFGAVAAAWALAQWQLLLHGSRAEKRFAAWTIVPYLGAVLLTESRGSMLALLFGFALSILLQPRRRRGPGLAAAGAAIGLSAAAAHFAFEAMKAGDPGNAAWPLGIATAACALAVLPLCGGARARTEIGKRVSAWLTTVPGGALVLAAGIALAYSLLVGGSSDGARVGGQFETASARQLYYADALRIFADYPLLGAGGRSWRTLVGLYRQEPYIGNEVHSGYLDVLIDAGLVGLLLLLGMLIWFAVRLRKKADRAWGPAAVLLAHSAIDFDWSYGFAWLLLLTWIALHSAAEEARDDPVREGPSRAGRSESFARAAAVPRRRPARRGIAGGLAGLIPAALLLGCAAAAVPAAWHSLAAARAYADAPAAAGPAREAKLRAALEANPEWTRIRLELASLLPARERAELLTAGLRHEPHSPSLALALGMAYAELGDAARAREHLREGLRLDRFNRDAQNAAIARMTRLAEKLSDAGEPSAAREAAGAAVEFFERYRELYRLQYEGEDNPWFAKRDNLFSGAKVNAAKSLLLLDRETEAAAMLQEVAGEEEGDWKEEAEALLRERNER